MRYFDSHAHYYDERFGSECEAGVDSLIGALFNSAVSGIINIGTSVKTSLEAISQAKRYPSMYTAIGLHPSDTRLIERSLSEEISEIEALIKNSENKCVALGEIGLDYHYPDTDKELQLRAFREQMSLAESLGIPVVIHDRDSHADVLDVIKQFPRVRGVLHSFSGSTEMACELVKRNYMISFSGTITFTNARRPREVAAKLPKESVMIETDCPYLCPHPHRGELNHSGMLEYTNRSLALCLGITEEECAAITETNARRFFKI